LILRKPRFWILDIQNRVTPFNLLGNRIFLNPEIPRRLKLPDSQYLYASPRQGEAIAGTYHGPAGTITSLLDPLLVVML
jgi:hypothetical protein